MAIDDVLRQLMSARHSGGDAMIFERRARWRGRVTPLLPLKRRYACLRLFDII